MDLKKIIKNKRNLLIGGVAIATLVTLTGCGKADVNIKVYDKENEVQQIINDAVSQVENEFENQSSDNTTTNTDNSTDTNTPNNNNNTDNSTKTKQNEYTITYENEEYITRNEEGKIAFKNERNLPTIESTSNSAAAKKMQNLLKEISDKNWNQVKDTADEFTGYGIPVYDTPYGVTYMMKTIAKTNNYITFEIDQEGSMGGVSWTARELYTFDAENGNLLTLKDMAKNESELKQFVHSEVKKYINNNFSDIQSSDLDSKIDEIIGETGNYGILEDTFVVILPKYSIGSGADGVRAVEINKSDINSYLAEKYKM